MAIKIKSKKGQLSLVDLNTEERAVLRYFLQGKVLECTESKLKAEHIAMTAPELDPDRSAVFYANSCLAFMTRLLWNVNQAETAAQNRVKNATRGKRPYRRKSRRSDESVSRVGHPVPAS